MCGKGNTMSLGNRREVKGLRRVGDAASAELRLLMSPNPRALTRKGILVRYQGQAHNDEFPQSVDLG